MFSKFDDQKSAKAKADRAVEKFHLAEDRCSDTNSRLYSNQDIRLENRLSARDVLYVARRKIDRVLGPFSWNEAERGFGFGPGATTRLRRDRSTLLHKISGKPEATSNCADLARTVLRYNRLWEELVLNESDSEEPIKTVRANRIVTVPKNAKIDRVIAIEPDMNIFVQKGIGNMIRRRLRRVGIDLNDQTVNQRLAKEGSVTGKLATIDLSMASDTVSRSIVEELLPLDWLMALEQCRSPFGVLPSGREILYRKFSSMGNGYTFELESLIFWSLCSALTELMGETDGTIGVYGDDLIVPVGIVRSLEDLLEYCGFSFNRKKSFFEGPFRESCGKHYFGGRDVTPIYVRKQPRRLSDVFLVHNNVTRWSNRGGHRDSGVGDLVERFCLTTRNAVPSNWRRPRIPDGMGDGAFIGSFSECTPTRATRGFEGWKASVLVRKQLDHDKTTTYETLGPVVASLYLLNRRIQREERVLGFRSTLRQSADQELHLEKRDTLVETGVPASFDACISDWSGIVSSRANPGCRRVVLRSAVTKVTVAQWAELGPWC